MPVKPISPNEIQAAQAARIPDEIIEIFNNLIAKNFNGSGATIRQSEALKTINENTNYSRDIVFENHYLDVEPAYREVGWKVKFDKPGYNESYDAYWEFSKK